MLDTGSHAPAFTLPDDRGTLVSLEDLLAGGPLILFFYPADFTPICTRQVCAVRDLHEDLEHAGLNVAGISADTIETHAAFRARHTLPYTLLSDPDRSVIKLYDVAGPLGFGLRRVTYLISQEGSIEDRLVADLRVSRHRSFLRNALRIAGLPLD